MDGNICFGDILWMESTWSTDSISVSFVGLDHDGNYRELCDMTDEFTAVF